MTEPPAEGDRSRRGLLAVAAASGGILLAGCGSKSLRSKVKRGASVFPADVEGLNRLLALEYYAIAAYTAGIPLLRRPQAKAAKQFLAQEVAHASLLVALVNQGGGTPIKARPSYDLGPPRRPDVLALMHRLESEQLAAYIRMIPQLSGGRLRSTVAAIVVNDAQHVAVLRQLLGRQPIPSAFATGAE